MDYGTAAEDFRLKEISNQTSAGAIISQHNYTFTADSQIATWNRTFGLGTSPPAETFTFTYDLADRLTNGVLKNTSTGAVLADHQFIYDPLDNRVSIREQNSLKSGVFNDANQLTAENGGGKVRITGSVNKAGAGVTVAGKAAAVHPNGGFAVEVNAAEGANHLPLVVTEADGTVTTKYVDVVFDQAEPLIYTYDANGNLETVAKALTPTSPTNSYEWDAADQLVAMVRVISPSETRRTEFLYNGGGSRVGKKEFLNGSLQSELKYIYGGTGVLQERSVDGGTVLKTYTSRGELDYTTTPPTPRYFTRDHLGSVREVVADDGSLLARYDYKPYGERVLVSGTYEATKGFTGHDYLPEAGMILTRYRAYDPLTGRWLSPDPIEEAGGMNLYGYVLGDPINLYDPDGRNPYSTADEAAEVQNWWKPAAAAAASGAAGAIAPRAAEDAGAAYTAAMCGGIDLIPDLMSSPGDYAEDAAIGAVTGLATAGIFKAGGSIFKPILSRLKRHSSPPGCFVAGTLVMTENGQKPIEEVETGDNVWSYHQESKVWELRKVVDTYAIDYTGEIVTLTISGEDIVATGNHPIWVVEGESLISRTRVESEIGSHEHALTKDGRWVEARHLKNGDHLSLKGGGFVRLDSITSELRTVKVFNFHVEGNQNYTVSRLGVLVHNSSSMPSNKPPLKRIHSDETLRNDPTSSLDYQLTRSTDDIIESLAPNADTPLRAWPDGRIHDGNTRIKVLQDRGVDVDNLPRTEYNPPKFREPWED